MKKKLAIILPVYNEEMSIEKVIKDWGKILPKAIFDLIVINDGSKDKTHLVIEKLKDQIKNLILRIFLHKKPHHMRPNKTGSTGN